MYGATTPNLIAKYSNTDSTEWWSTGMIIVASMLGTGVLGIPFAIAQLGWMKGMISLILLAVGAVYSGNVLYKLQRKVPEARAMSDLGLKAMGTFGQTVVMAVAYLYMFGVSIILQLTATLAMQQTVYGLELGQWVASGVVAVMAIPLLQFRKLDQVGWLATFGVVGILVPCGIVVGQLWMNESEEMVELNGVKEIGNESIGFINLIYAYAGQAIFVELIAKMKQPQDFPKAVVFSVAVMLFTYVVVGGIGYVFLGASVKSPITSALPQNAWTQIMNAFLLGHLVIAYVIEINILTSAVVPDGMRATKTKMLWFIVSSCLVMLCLVLGNAIPFLGDLMGLFGAIGSVSTTYTFPCLFNIMLRKHEIDSTELSCCVILVALSIVAMFFGVTSSVNSILLKY